MEGMSRVKTAFHCSSNNHFYFYEPGGIATIKRPLRRTLQLFVQYWAMPVQAYKIIHLTVLLFVNFHHTGNYLVFCCRYRKTDIAFR